MSQVAHLAFWFAFLTAAGLRLSWLLIEDEVTAVPRGMLIERAQAKGRLRLANFFVCPFCIGFWSQVVLVAVACQFVSLPMPVLWPLAINIVASPIHFKLDAATRG